LARELLHEGRVLLFRRLLVVGPQCWRRQQQDRQSAKDSSHDAVLREEGWPNERELQHP
jgi:hypothetical protein